MKKIDYLIRKLKEYSSKNKKDIWLMVNCYPDKNFNYDKYEYAYEDNIIVDSINSCKAYENLVESIPTNIMLPELREISKEKGYRLILQPMATSIKELFEDEV